MIHTRHNCYSTLWAMKRYYAPSAGTDVPANARSGPLLVVSNHPGLGDFPAILERLGRDDVQVIVKRRELMRDMTGILKHCIVIDNDMSSRARAVLSAIDHLKNNVVLIGFPAGEIEHEPTLLKKDTQCRSFFEPLVSHK